ncbi:MAG: tripartite tricarboxylate transporter substrate binding protein, partial [Betaproteobacteria bacterium]
DPWLGLFMPARVSSDIISKANAEVVRILNAPDLKSRLASQGIEIVTSSPAEFARFIREDNAKWGKLIREANIHGE